MQRIFRENCLTRCACLVGASTIIIAAGLVAGPVQAQEKFPSKPIEIVTHAGAGGGTDVSVRMTILKARKIFKQDIVVVSKQGGNGALAINYVCSSRPTATR